MERGGVGGANGMSEEEGEAGGYGVAREGQREG